MERGEGTEGEPRGSRPPATKPDANASSSWLASYEAFTLHLPGAWWIKDSSGAYVYANRTTEAILGAPPGGVLGKTDADLLPGEAARALRDHDRQVLETGEPLQVLEQINNADGETRSWFSAKFPLQAALERYTAGFAVDVTLVLKNKRDADGMLQQILDAITDMVLVKGPQSQLEWANKAFLSVYGMTNAELQGIIDAPFIEPDLTQQYVRDDLQVFSTGIPLEIPEEEMIRHDGKVLMCHTVKSPIFDSRGKVIKTVAVIRDATESKRLELELRQAQKLESVGRLASGIAHEINTPIQFVSDEATFLRSALTKVLALCDTYRVLVDKAERGDLSSADVAAVRRAESDVKLPFIIDNVPPAIEAILEGTRRIAELVQSMKEFAHPDRDDKELSDINHALKTTATICANETKYVAEVELDLGSLPMVNCYVNELNQVFVNLIVNAAHAVGDVVAGTTERGKIRLVTRHVEDDVIVSISDTGTGITEALRPKIFDRFFTTKALGKGTGQGLALARMIVVDKHQGSLTFDTEVGAGTTFHIRIPISPPEVGAAPPRMYRTDKLETFPGRT